MHTGPQYPSTQQQTPGPGGGRGGTLLIAVVSFAVVFLLIVGATVGYLVLRTGSPGGAAPAPSSTQAGTPVDPESTGPDSPTPTDVEEVRCWSPETIERTSQNPSGKLRGGGLQFIPPTIFDQRHSTPGNSYMNDIQSAQAHVEATWYSVMTVAKVEWQPGIEYPGAEVASQKILSCYFSANIWGETTGRQLVDEITEPVTVAGMPGYRTTATVTFATSPLKLTTGTALQVVVVETPQGPSAFVSETAIGVTEHEEAAVQAYESLTGVG